MPPNTSSLPLLPQYTELKSVLPTSSQAGPTACSWDRVRLEVAVKGGRNLQRCLATKLHDDTLRPFLKAEHRGGS
jgi:hypothetical protein